MPILTPPPPLEADVRPLWDVEAPLAHGMEGLRLRDQMLTVSAHWHVRTEGERFAGNGDEPTYQHVPLANAGTRRVRYIRTETLSPRRITIDTDFDD
jgi:hypothetical protein